MSTDHVEVDATPVLVQLRAAGMEIVTMLIVRARSTSFSGTRVRGVDRGDQAQS
jgi:hypothetical protein